MKEEEVNGHSEMDDSFLQGLNKNPFLVPDNYFDNLYHQTISEKNIAGLKDKELFKTPELYFNQLEGQIMAQINISKDKSANEFAVPDGYFNRLPQSILDKIETPAKPKNRIFKLSFIKYAAASVILLATTLGVYNNYYTENASVSDKLSKIPNQEIMDYLNTYSDTNEIILILEDTDDISLIEENISHL